MKLVQVHLPPEMEGRLKAGAPSRSQRTSSATHGSGVSAGAWPAQGQRRSTTSPAEQVLCRRPLHDFKLNVCSLRPSSGPWKVEAVATCTLNDQTPALPNLLSVCIGVSPDC
jgi:hypothetical protein